MYEFWYDYAKLKYDGKQNFVIIYVKTEIFIKTLQKILKQDLIFQIMN